MVIVSTPRVILLIIGSGLRVGTSRLSAIRKITSPSGPSESLPTASKSFQVNCRGGEGLEAFASFRASHESHKIVVYM